MRRTLARRGRKSDIRPAREARSHAPGASKPPSPPPACASITGCSAAPAPAGAER